MANDNIATGAGYIVRGAKMLGHKNLRLFVIIPLLINILIFGSLIGFGLSYLDTQMDRFLGWVPDWLSFVEWILWPLIGIVFSLMTGYMFTALALIIASPFNALLAEKAEELITGKPVDSLEGLGAALMAVPRGILREIYKLLY
jgi:CysZ protein